MATHYQLLGISQNAGEAEIKRAYRALAMQFHPDRNTAPDASRRFIEIQNAYDILMDENQRASYDRILSGGFDFSEVVSGSANYYEPPIDPFTGRKNYKYHRGKPKEERDLNAPFENFQNRTIENFELDFEVVSRVWMLALPGFFATLFFTISNYDGIDGGDVVLTVPLMLFHLFVIFDCLLPTNTFYGLLTKVIIDKYSDWKELFIKTTSYSTPHANYVDNKKSEWYTDRIYLYQSWVDFSNVQQFFIHRSPIFKIKFQIQGIVDDKLVDLKLNSTKWQMIVILSVIQFFVLLYFVTISDKHFSFYPILLFVQIQIIGWTLASSRQTHNDQLNFLLRWF